MKRGTGVNGWRSRNWLRKRWVIIKENTGRKRNKPNTDSKINTSNRNKSRKHKSWHKLFCNLIVCRGSKYKETIYLHRSKDLWSVCSIKTFLYNSWCLWLLCLLTFLIFNHVCKCSSLNTSWCFEKKKSKIIYKWSFEQFSLIQLKTVTLCIHSLHHCADVL